MTTSLTTSAAVRARSARKVYGSGENAVTALDNVSLDVPDGQFLAVMGPSGSGKSTLLHCLAGLDSLSAGEIFIGDSELGRLSERQLTRLRRDRIGVVFQAFNLLPTLSALDNITLPATLAGAAPDRDWLESVIDTVGLSGRLSHRPAELSGGQQQRVAVARALASKPEIIFADEPTGNLDLTTQEEVMDIFARLAHDENKCVIVVSHSPEVAASVDEVYELASFRDHKKRRLE